MSYNIGLFNDSFPPTIDGVANAVYNYADILTKSGNKVTVVTPEYPNVIDEYEFDVERYGSISVSKKLGYRMGNVLPLKTLNKLKSKKFDLIHVHAPFVSSLVANELKKTSKNIPMVFTYHTKFDIEFEKRIKLKSFKSISTKFIKRNIQLADEVWVVSEGAVQSLRNIGYNGPYKVMRNGTDFEKGKSSPEAVERLKKYLNIAPDEAVLLFVGRMMWYKNIGLIMDALAKMPKDFRYKAVFVGSGYDRAGMEQYAKHLKIYEKCIFAGAVYDRDKLREYYSIGDLFLFPSTYDTAGLVVMEAAATGLPSVLIKGSCAAEGVTDERNGFLCKEEPDDLCKTIIKAFENPEKLKEIGIMASKEVYYPWEEAVKAAEKRYEEIIESNKKQPKKVL